MRKLRDDSNWSQLTFEQRETVEGWLFDENLSYPKTVERVQKEFGLAMTTASVGRYFRRRAQERQVVEVIEAQATADDLNGLPLSVRSLCSAGVKLVGKAALRLAGEKPDELQQLVSLTRVLLDNERNELRRARLKLAEKYFDYEATAAAAKELPHTQAYLKILDDSDLSHDEKLDRVHAFLYGWEQSKLGGNEAKESEKANEEGKPYA